MRPYFTEISRSYSGVLHCPTYYDCGARQIFPSVFLCSAMSAGAYWYERRRGKKRYRRAAAEQFSSVATDVCDTFDMYGLSEQES